MVVHSQRTLVHKLVPTLLTCRVRLLCLWIQWLRHVNWLYMWTILYMHVCNYYVLPKLQWILNTLLFIKDCQAPEYNGQWSRIWSEICCWVVLIHSLRLRCQYLCRHWGIASHYRKWFYRKQVLQNSAISGQGIVAWPGTSLDIEHSIWWERGRAVQVLHHVITVLCLKDCDVI